MPVMAWPVASGAASNDVLLDRSAARDDNDATNEASRVFAPPVDEPIGKRPSIIPAHEEHKFVGASIAVSSVSGDAERYGCHSSFFSSTSCQ